MSAPIIPGAEPLSHAGTRDAGVLVLHGFTGNPGSMRGLAEACVAAGFHVEMPRLAGHGTVVDEMIPTRWADWTRDVEDAWQRLASRTDRITVMGLSMGGSLTLWTALTHPETRGIVCINPAVRPQPDEVLEGIRGLLAAGTETMESIGSDIADPDSTEAAYDATPLAPLLSFQVDGLIDIAPRYATLRMPLLLFTSVNDHVVSPADSDHLASVYGGPVEHVVLERSFHVATQDYDKQTIFDASVAFADRVTR
ncbi:MAG: hypothetical protein RL330_662 [Actinomycetota bacterium]